MSEKLLFKANGSALISSRRRKRSVMALLVHNKRSFQQKAEFLSQLNLKLKNRPTTVLKV